MPGRIGLVVIHGMGAQQTDFANALLTARQRGTVDRIEDHETFVTSWNPASHNDYWTDSDFTRPVAEYLSALLRAV
jgi:hypothetical protein